MEARLAEENIMVLMVLMGLLQDLGCLGRGFFGYARKMEHTAVVQRELYL